MKTGKRKVHKSATNFERTFLNVDVSRRHTALQHPSMPARNVKIPTSNHLKKAGYNAPSVHCGVTGHVKMSMSFKSDALNIPLSRAT
jgi:hypothetical protein